MGADGRDVGFLVGGVVGPEAGEDFQGVLPVCAGPLVLVQGVVCVGDSVVGARLVLGLTEFGGGREGLAVVVEGGPRVARGVVCPAEALPYLQPLRTSSTRATTDW